MATRTQVLAPIAAAAAIIGIAGMLSLPEDAKLESAEFPIGTVRIGDQYIQVQVADTKERQARGLMFQEQLPHDQAMIFVFDSPGTHSMWMLNMQFAIDIIWFDAGGQVVHIEEGVPPCKSALETASCTSVNNPESGALYVLEGSAGFVRELGIGPDSVLEIISI